MGLPPELQGESKAYAEMDREYQSTRETLTLPVGIDWPAHAPNDTPVGEDEVAYEAGYGVAEAMRFWFCAWSHEWVTTINQDSLRSEAALRHLQQYRNMLVYRYLVEGQAKVFLEATISGAELGAADNVNQYLASSCHQLAQQLRQSAPPAPAS
ncbi:MAG TPA: hypothetical protein VFX60_06135 [Micromonospora sp.]|nr:hypothetical protein [Micromonospora sp.]